MSEIKVNKISPRTACGTVTLGDSGDTFTIPAGATINNLGTASGFGATGAVNWDVASIKTVDFTAVSGNGYFVDTATTGAVEVTLPAAPSVGDVVGVSDYAKNFKTANCTLNRNSLKIGGVALNSILKTNGIAVTLVYVDATKGWIVTDSGNQSDAPTDLYVAATGGCITTCGDYKIHTFNSPATFTVTCAGNPSGSTTVDYLVIGGGGGAAAMAGGGGGAGGYRESSGTASGCYTIGLPANSGVAAVSVSASPGAYPIIVGGGGTATTVPQGTPADATAGDNSSALGITSQGGGGSVGHGNPAPTSPTDTSFGAGGSGSGGSAGNPGACGTYIARSGNTPPTTPSQGNDGGTAWNSPGSPAFIAGGGGGAGACGVPGDTSTYPTTSGNGGAGATSSINATPTARAGGGGGGAYATPQTRANQGAGGTGGGGNGGYYQFPTVAGGDAGGCNTGGGGGGGGRCTDSNGGNGGSGVVILRYKYQ